MSPGFFFRLAVRLAFTILLLTASTFAQDARGTITGRATDTTGAALPNASVQVTNVATGVSVNVRTNEAGNFVIPYLTPGIYTLTVEQTGFRKFVQEQLQVRTNETVEVNPQLQVGDAKESVTVTAETPLLATAEVSMGQVVDTRRIEELPLFAGNALDLVHLAPGTVNGMDMRLRKAPFNNAPSQFSTDGSGNYNNEFTIDGVSNLYSDGTQPRVAFSPPQTAISEFKVQTSAFDATVGHTLGSVVNLVTKGGTNTIHGEAHEWLRHSMFDARPSSRTAPARAFRFIRTTVTAHPAAVRLSFRDCMTGATKRFGISPGKRTSSAIRTILRPRPCRPSRCGAAISRDCSR